MTTRVDENRRKRVNIDRWRRNRLRRLAFKFSQWKQGGELRHPDEVVRIVERTLWLMKMIGPDGMIIFLDNTLKQE